jgi:hypothetical protein
VMPFGVTDDLFSFSPSSSSSSSWRCRRLSGVATRRQKRACGWKMGKWGWIGGIAGYCMLVGGEGYE